jgi:hypothetical protein
MEKPRHLAAAVAALRLGCAYIRKRVDCGLVKDRVELLIARCASMAPLQTVPRQGVLAKGFLSI